MFQNLIYNMRVFCGAEVPAADLDLQRAGATAGQRVLALLQGHLRGGLGDRDVHHGHLPPR